MCSSSAPAPPDPQVTAAAQTQSNIQTANNNATLNRVNQYTPYGNLTYSIDGTTPSGTPQYSANVSLSPQEQQIFDSYTKGQINQGNIALGMQGQVGNSYTNPINTGGLPGLNFQGGNTGGIGSQITNNGPGMTGTVNNGSYSPQAIQDAEDAAYKQQTQYLDPQYAQAGKSLDNSLINQGITQGSEAYNNAQTLYNNQKQQAYGNAQMQAVQAGQNEQNIQFGQGLQASQLQNSANQQGFTQGATQLEAQNQAQQQLYGQQYQNAGLQNSANQEGIQNIFALRNQPLNEYNALMTGAQVQQPNFVSVPGVNQAGTDVAGITNQGYQNQLAAFQQNQAGINNLFSLGGSLGAAAIFASDRRVKRDITRVGETPSGIPLYSFTYVWDDGKAGPPVVGVMADEIAPKIPEAVFYDDDGFAYVDYSRVR
jgi:hypothetical protein